MSREPKVADVLERACEAGQSLIARGVDLFVPESRQLLRDGRLVGIAILVALAGWIFLMLGAVDALSERAPRFAVELGVGAAHAAFAALLLLRGRASARREAMASRLGPPADGPGLPQARALVAGIATPARKAAPGAARSFPEGALEWLRANAWASLAGATALGLLVARALRPRR